MQKNDSKLVEIHRGNKTSELGGESNVTAPTAGVMGAS